MKLAELAAKPKLTKIEINDEDTIAEFGEPLEFYTWDRQPMDVFLSMSNINNENYTVIVETIKRLVLDDQGKPIISGEVTLPTKIMLRVITKVVETLGK